MTFSGRLRLVSLLSESVFLRYCSLFAYVSVLNIFSGGLRLAPLFSESVFQVLYL